MKFFVRIEYYITKTEHLSDIYLKIHLNKVFALIAGHLLFYWITII